MTNPTRPTRPEPAWRRYLRFLRPDVSADIDDELQFHLAMREREYERRGMSPDDARRAAVARFGDVGGITRWLHDHDHRREGARRRRETTTMILQHLRHAARSLVRQPTFAAAAVLTLAFGIGGTTAVFAVVNAVLLEPLPYPDPERLVSIQHTSPAVPDVTIGQSHAGYETYRRLNHVFVDVGLHFATAVNITDGVTPERIAADSATAGIFTSLRVTPLLGRLFGEADERPGHAPVVVISEGLWRRRFNGDRAVVGRSLMVDGRAHEVIGVLPARVRFPDEAVELWLPLHLDPSDPVPARFNYASVG